MRLNRGEAVALRVVENDQDSTRSGHIAGGLCARLWADRARAELGRIGGRPSTPYELTETEKNIAALVARGRTNQEAADALFISPSTVQANLKRVYQKLGVRSRTELAARLGRVEDS